MLSVLIHAVPKRMWYVQRYMVPALQAQGIEPEIFCDEKRLGNLGACLESLRNRHGDGTWHLQDDVLICRDFAERATKYDTGICNGFCHLNSGDSRGCVGEVYPPELWNGFPCVRIPDDIGRDFVRWVENETHESWVDIQIRRNKADDWIFHRYVEDVHPYIRCRNIGPNLVEHVDWLIGGSVVNEWRGYICRSDYWEDEELVQELKERLQRDKNQKR